MINSIGSVVFFPTLKQNSDNKEILSKQLKIDSQILKILMVTET